MGNQPLLAVAETLIGYVLAWIALWRIGGFEATVPALEATTRFNAAAQAAIPGATWMSECDSWYIGGLLNT